MAAYNYQIWLRDQALLKARGSGEPLLPPQFWPRRPKVSVLVAAWDEAVTVARHIRSFLALRYPHKELVLCAGGADGTHAIAAGYSGEQVTVLHQQWGEGKQRALGRCLEAASGEVIFLTDADCTLDDDAFERTLYPVVVGEAGACTGSSRPFAELMTSPFVIVQAAAQTYSAMHGPSHGPGILGRNCAVNRAILERSGGLRVLAPTGTDYVLAKKLTEAGVQIRQEPRSRVATEYPTAVGPYIRQQQRWLRNVVMHGLSFRAYDEVARTLATSLIGGAMLAGPLLAWLPGWRRIAIPWLLAWAHVLLSRWRYINFFQHAVGGSFPRLSYLSLPSYIVADFIIWAGVLLQHPSRSWRHRW
jgi:cellulose synthase/poly-beta-1,6-N-acetylglucosamine synthase-like glycosyltransferase